MIDPAPIILFVYDRPEHTRLTLEALTSNSLAAQSVLHIYSDAPKNSSKTENVQTVRSIAHATTGFKSVEIIERDTHYGLTRNITDGVSQVCSSEGRVIVLEDDILTSPLFLEFMNLALEQYANNPDVWHISGWNYPIEDNDLFDAFFWRIMNSRGWATWSDRWQHFNKDPKTLVRTWKREKIRQFNLDGKINRWREVKGNYSGKIDTWAVFWYATIFEQNGMCLNPAISFATRMGPDSCSEQCDETNQLLQAGMAQRIGRLPLVAIESQLAIQVFNQYLKDNSPPNFLKTIATRMHRLLGIPEN